MAEIAISAGIRIGFVFFIKEIERIFLDCLDFYRLVFWVCFTSVFCACNAFLLKTFFVFSCVSTIGAMEFQQIRIKRFWEFFIKGKEKKEGWKGAPIFSAPRFVF